jgi:hypothetical protein
MDYIKIINDEWSDFNKVWTVLEYNNNPDSNTVSLVLEDADTKQVIHKIVTSHQIEWLEAKDW